MLYDTILILCGKNGISIARLEREAGLGNGTIRRWKKSSPNTDNLKRVAEYFGLGLDELFARGQDNKNAVQ